MSTDIMQFRFEDHDVRVIDRDGEARFVAADVVAILDIGRVHDAVRGLDDDEKGADTVRTPGGDQEVTTVTEAGMYSLVLRSRKPEAKAFKRWITHDVLPSIRKHGGYLTPEAVEKALLDPDVLIQLASNLKEERQARARAEKARDAIESYAHDLEPKAEAYAAFMDTEGTYSIGTVAKMFGLSQNKLFDLLRGHGILIPKGHLRNTPYSTPQLKPHFRVTASMYTRSDGTTSSSYTTRVLPSGVEVIRKRLGLSEPKIPAGAAK